MSSNLHEIIIKIKDEATKWLQSIQKWVDGMLENIERHKEGIQSIGVASGVAFAGLTGGIMKAVGEANKLENALMGLESIVVGTGGNFEDAKKKIQEFTADGLLGIDEASLALKNLLARGYGQDEALAVMSRIKDAAAYGRQAGLSLGEAVVTATEGLKNENSILVDNAGITKNVAKMWEDYAKQIGKSTKDLTDAEKRQAEINGIMEETKFQIGDAEKVSKTFSGTLLRVQGGISTLFAEIGATVKPVLNDLLVTIEPIIAKITTWITNNQELAGKILLVATAVTGIIAVMAGLALALWPIISGISLLGTIIGALISPIGLVIGAIVALGVAYTTNFMGFKDIVDSVVAWIMEKLQIFGAFLAEVWNIYWPPFLETVTLLWESLKVVFETAFLIIRQNFENFLNGLKILWDIFWPAITEMIRMLWETIKAVFSTAFGILKTIVDTGLKVIKWIFDIFAGVLTGDWWRVWEWIKWIVTGILWGIGGFIKEILTGVLKWIGGVFWIDLVGSFTNAFEKAKEATIGIVTWMVDKVKWILEWIRTFIGGIVDGITGAGDRAREIQSSVRANSGSGGIAGARASGWPVSAGSQYLVGERGPELFVPQTSGYIVPNKQLSGGATININMSGVIIKNEADENRLAEKISQKLAREAKLYKLGIS